MDETDRALIAALSKDARTPVTTLARRLNLARSTVQARIDRLESRGVIAGYALKLGDGARAGEIRATVLLTLAPRAAAPVLSRLKALIQVARAHTASGRFDMVLEVVAGSTAELDRTLDRIGEIDGVRSSESLIQLSTRISRGD